MRGGGDTPAKTLWKFNSDEWTFGEYQNKQLAIAGTNESKYYVTDEDGKILSLKETNEQDIEYLKHNLEDYLGEIKSVRILIISGLTVGDDVPNWEDYINVVE